MRLRPLPAPGRGLATLAVVLALCLALPVRSEPATRLPEVTVTLQIVHQARAFEDQGAYGRALAEWRRLRSLVPMDGDLELVTALDEARAGQLDSAAVRLADPVLSAAAMDTLPTARYQIYGLERDTVYLNRSFDGWHWYVWRARAEVAMARGRWEEATVAARRCVAARPTTGKEWLLLAVCAGHAGLADEARAAVGQATLLDATLPEAHYLAGLWAWRDGRRPEAQACFRAAVRADSGFRAPVVALVRSRLPGSMPDSLPTAFLTGRRAVGMLTSAFGPKQEGFLLIEQAHILSHRVNPVLPDTVRARLRGQRVLVSLFVDEDGRVILIDLPWSAGRDYPTPVIAELLTTFNVWRFRPAKTQDRPIAAWVDVQYPFPR